MTTKQTTIDGYTVELDTDMSGVGEDNADRVTGCWISFRAGRHEYVASLALLCDGGVLEDDYAEHVVPASTVEKIEDWAQANGY